MPDFFRIWWSFLGCCYDLKLQGEKNPQQQLGVWLDMSAIAAGKKGRRISDSYEQMSNFVSIYFYTDAGVTVWPYTLASVALFVRSSLLKLGNVKKSGLLNWIKNERRSIQLFSSLNWTELNEVNILNFERWTEK